MSKESAMTMITGATVAPSVATIPPASTVADAPAVPVETPKAPSSSEFAKMAKKEAERVRREQDFKKQQEEFAKEREQVQKIKAEYDNFQQTKVKDPVAAMKQLGFTETEIFNWLANEAKPEMTAEEKAAKAAADATEAKLKEFQELQTKREQEAQIQKDQKLVQNFRSEIAKTVSANKNEFKLSALNGSVAEELAYETVVETLKASNGEDLLSPKEAMEMVENYYKGVYEDMKKALEPAQEASPPVETKKQPERSRTVSAPAGSTPVKPSISHTRTLTNQATQTMASSAARRNETASQKRERLIERLRTGNLN